MVAVASDRRARVREGRRRSESAATANGDTTRPEDRCRGSRPRLFKNLSALTRRLDVAATPRTVPRPKARIAIYEIALDSIVT
jgi:hypothetical protein